MLFSVSFTNVVADCCTILDYAPPLIFCNNTAVAMAVIGSFRGMRGAAEPTHASSLSGNGRVEIM